GPSWHTEQRRQMVLKQGDLRRPVLDQLTRDPITQLFAFVQDPDFEEWAKVAHWLPLMFIRDKRFKAEAPALGEWALALLEGRETTLPPGNHACAYYTDGPLAVTLAWQPDTKTVSAVLVLDDRDEALDTRDGDAWREWLRLSNWFGLRDTHLVTTRSLLAGEPTAPEPRVDAGSAPALSAQWQTLHDESIA